MCGRTELIIAFIGNQLRPGNYTGPELIFISVIYFGLIILKGVLSTNIKNTGSAERHIPVNAYSQNVLPLL